MSDQELQAALEAGGIREVPDAGRAGIRIFIKAPNWVGDAVMATPTLAHVRSSLPEARIVLMARPWVAPVFEHSGDFDELWVHDDAASNRSFRQAVKMVRRERFDVGLALPGSWRAALLLRMGGVKYRIGYRNGLRGLLLNYGVKLTEEMKRAHQVYYYVRLVRPLCPALPARPRLKVAPGEVEREEVQRMLFQKGLDRGQMLVGVAPGSINSTAKRWPAERFARLIERIVEQWDADVILLGSRREADVLEECRALCEVPVHMPGELNLAQAIALIERLDGLVCNDSGAMHLGAAMGKAVAAIFGPTEWYATYPFHPRASVVRKEGVDCAPCMLRECPIDHRCMTGVTVDMVLSQLKQQLERRAS